MQKAFNILVLLIISSSISFAQDIGCRISTGISANLGDVTSFAIQNTTPRIAMESTGLECDLGLSSLSATEDLIEATIKSMNNGYLQHESIAPNENRVNYSIFYDQSYSSVVNYGNPINFTDGNHIGFLNISSNNKLTVPIYIRVNPGNYNIVAGKYLDVIQIDWRWNLCSHSDSSPSCMGEKTITIQINLSITEDCKITASDINFGNSPIIANFDDVFGTVNVICTKGSTYSVGLSDGEHEINGQRRINSGSNYIAYEIYKGMNKGIRWGSLGNERRKSTDADINPNVGGWGDKVQTFNYTAEILKNQENQPSGQYTDYIVVEVKF